MPSSNIVIAGAGIFGATAAVALRHRGYVVTLLNPGSIPHPLAASTDISKVVRMEYGADTEYMDMVATAIGGWHAWNDRFGETLYHETGFLMLSRAPAGADDSSFEMASYRNLLQKGFQPERLDAAQLARRFPTFGGSPYTDAFFNPRAGFAESGRVVRALTEYAVQLGVSVQPGQTADRIDRTSGRVRGVYSREGAFFAADQVLVCAGAYTPYLLPELQPYMRITGHPVFHLRPARPDRFTPPHFSVFTADISNTGWYGFPLHPREGVVKIANHGIGQLLHPEADERIVTEADGEHLRDFLRESLPALADAPIVYTRRCLYNDTLDGHFWIDRHPAVSGLHVAAGGSGHAFKMAPVLGDLIADALEGRSNPLLHRHRWRALDEGTPQQEEARYKAGAK